jgi:hypothetical protein
MVVKGSNFAEIKKGLTKSMTLEKLGAEYCIHLDFPGVGNKAQLKFSLSVVNVHSDPLLESKWKLLTEVLNTV